MPQVWPEKAKQTKQEKDYKKSWLPLVLCGRQCGEVETVCAFVLTPCSCVTLGAFPS